MPTRGTILIVDDDPDILTAGKLLLKRHYARIDTTEDPAAIPDLMAGCTYDAILLDMNFSPGASDGKQGFRWLTEILRIDPDAVVVLITAHGGVDIAVDAMKLGATDFIAKPWQNQKLVATLSASVKLRQTRSEAARLKEANTTLASLASGTGQPILGTSPAMQRVLDLVERSAPTDANVLILGENGTGKELIARALHQASARSEHVFVPVDLGAVTESLFESELFGVTRGAFTDAKQDRAGRMVAAVGGTLFLDEVGNLPLHLQAKLLSVLERREVTPVGATSSTAIDVRVIAATNLPREQLQDEATFRQDLLFRLNTVEIELPPLRDRAADIPVIASFFLDQYARKYGKSPMSLDPAAADAISGYHWPGNIRALRHAVERAVILAEHDTLTIGDFQLDSASPAQPAADLSAEGELNLERLEKNAIQQCLVKHRYNISHAAKELGLTRAALYRRMEKHGL